VGDYASLIHVSVLSTADAMLQLQAKLSLSGEHRVQATDFLGALELIPLAIMQAAAYFHKRVPRMTLSRYTL
jgi:hypothetical protein